MTKRIEDGVITQVTKGMLSTYLLCMTFVWFVEYVDAIQIMDSTTKIDKTKTVMAQYFRHILVICTYNCIE